jgi:hypothetical protein
MLVALLVVAGLLVCVGVLSERKRRVRSDLPPAKISDGEPLRGDENAEPTTNVRNGGEQLVRIVFFLVGGGLLLKMCSGLFSRPDSMTKGRLLRVRNRARLPRTRHGDDWHHGAGPEVANLAPAERAALGELWLLAAHMEHASVAAFSSLSLHLSALGAPPALLVRTHQAALDEIRHAQRCYAIASAYAGRALSAGPIVELQHPGKHGGVDLVRLAVGSLVDGCVAEGLASDVARHSAQAATDPVVRETLAMIADDEAGHAELAWAILQWCIDQHDPAVLGALTDRIARLHQQVTPALPSPAGVAAAALTAHGVVSQSALGTLATARIDAVATRARALLQRTAAPALAA